MSGLFKKKESVPQASPTVSSVRFNTSCFGKPIPISYGRTRLAGNLLWYGGFKAIPHTTQQSVGGKGGSHQTIEQTTYTYEVSLIFGFGHGPTTGAGVGYAGRNIYAATTTYNVTDTTNEYYDVPDGLIIDVANKAAWVSDINIMQWTPLSQGDSGDYWGWAQLPWAQYSAALGRYTFDSGVAGKQIAISYTYNAGTKTVDALAAMGLTYFTGAMNQAAWSFMASTYPNEALAYRGIAYAAAQAYQLGESADIPNTSLEVQSIFAYSEAIYDANPKDVLIDIATNQLYGGYFDATKIGDLSSYSDYCVAQGLFISPTYTEQVQLSDVFQKIAQITNSDFVFGDRKLKIVPYADKAVTGNGKTWNPNLTAIYDFVDDDFLPNADSGPVKVKRKSPQERFNYVVVKFYNRALHYTEDIVEAKDTAHIERYGVRPAPLVELYEVVNADVAKLIAQLILQRHISINNSYVFRVGFNRCLAEPMDLVTVSDSTLGLNSALCRITQIDESDDELTIEAEEVPVGSASAILYPRQPSSGYNANYGEVPDVIEPPLIVEAPVDYSEQTGLGLFIAATGKASDPIWGGCYIWASLDGSTYRRIGQIASLPRYGFLESAITSSGAQTIALTLSGKGGQMLSGTAAEAAAYATLCAVTNGIDVEYMSYQNATLVATNRYQLTPLVRGQFSTPAAAWGAGTKLIRIDSSIFNWLNLPIDYIGKTVYFKFTSFNIYGGGEQELANVAAHEKFIYGYMVKLPPPNVTGLAVTLEGYGIRITWDKSTATDINQYELRRGTQTDTWSTADATIAFTSGTSFLWETRVLGAYRFFAKAIDNYGMVSEVAAQCDFSIVAPSVSNFQSTFPGDGSVRLTWVGAEQSFAILGYEIRYGTTWAGGTYLAQLQTSTYSEAVKYGGTRKYWVAPYDVANNYGTPVSVDVTITNPSAVQALRADVVDNNVLLFWTAPVSGSLPVSRYDVRKGIDWASGTPIGSNGSSTFTTYFEVLSNTYTYWVAAVDTGNNTGTPASISAKVDQPPDFKLNYNDNDTFNGTKTNAALDGGVLVAPINATETWADHFTTNGWANMAAAIAAGKVYYPEPVPTTASYTDVIDIGTTLTSSIVSLVMTSIQRFGTVAYEIKIDVSNTSNTGPWAQEITGTSGFFSTFRWVRFRITFTGVGGNDMMEISIFNERAAVKLVDASGTKACLASDTGGTIIYLTDDGTAGGIKMFADIDTIIVTPQGTTAVIPVVDFTDIANPLSFKVLLFNDGGTRIDGTVRWQANGVRVS